MTAVRQPSSALSRFTDPELGGDLQRFESAGRPRLWLVWRSAALDGLLRRNRSRRDRLFVAYAVTWRAREYLEAEFDSVVTASTGLRVLPRDELTEALAAPNRQDLVVAAIADSERRAVVLIRGSLDRLVVPFDWFRQTPAGPAPRFEDLAIGDHGLTLRLGSYEAAVSAILYDFDAEYRRREKARWIEFDDSFGGSLRRLRLERGLARTEFPGVSAREIGRIERGEVKRPQQSTIDALARTLKVGPREIETY